MENYESKQARKEESVLCLRRKVEKTMRDDKKLVLSHLAVWQLIKRFYK